jgi:hypothetical protein
MSSGFPPSDLYLRLVSHTATKIPRRIDKE